MRTAETYLLIILVILISWACPKVSRCVELKPAQYDNLNYVCVRFKGFPFGVLWKLRTLAPTVRQQLPEGLHIGLEKRSGQGSLIFSYQVKTGGALVSMRYQGPTVFQSSISTQTGSPSQLNQHFLLSKDSNTMVIETLKELFINFCLTWEKEQLPANVEKIVPSGIRIASSYPDPFSINPFTLNP